jgi:hypothetical protein
MISSAAALTRSGETDAVVLIKAAPQVGDKHGETVCCAAIDLHGQWLRLYPVAFRSLEQGQKFGRWDRIKFRWRLPDDDRRIESRRVDQHTLAITGKLKKSERQQFLAKLVVTSLTREREEGRSLALLKPEIIGFDVERKSAEELQTETAKFAALRAQTDLFNTKPIIPYQPCPFRFGYRYRTNDGERAGTCQDWEMEATYYNWSRSHGEVEALKRIKQTFGENYPRLGMLLAMGTHSLYPDTWLINGVIRLDDIDQLALL